MVQFYLKGKVEIQLNNMSISRKYIYQYQLWRFLDHIFGNEAPSNKFRSQRNDLISRLNNDLSVLKKLPRTVQVDRVKNISDKDIKERYINRGIPVVLEGRGSDWDACGKWSPQWLLQNFNKDKLSFFDASLDDNTNLTYDVTDGSIQELINAMKKGDTNVYSRFNRILYDHPNLLNDFDWRWLYKMRSIFSSGKTFQVFIGGKGTRTTLHCASENNLFTQVYGEKHWYLYPPENDIVFNPPITRSPYFYSEFDPEKPDFLKFKNAKYIDKWECILKPGDILYNPPSWWHHVTNMSDSIGVGFRWFNLVDSFKMNFMHTLLTFISTNPSILYATKNRTNFAKIFKKMGES